MTHGIELLTSAGDFITRFDNVLYEKDSGELIDIPDPTNFTNSAPRVFAENSSMNNMLVGHSIRLIDFQNVGNIEVPTDIFIAAETWEYTDIPFYEVGSIGVYWAMQFGVQTDTTDGSQMTVCTDGENKINWKVGSITPPSAPIGEFGMQLTNENGDLVFDSRHKHLPLTSHFYVSNADASSVLENDIAIDYTLPEAMPNALIGIPYWAHFKRVTSNHAYFIKIEQTSPTNIRISRTYQYSRVSPRDPNFATFWHDATILIAANI